jgi:DNA adenine methylase
MPHVAQAVAFAKGSLRTIVNVSSIPQRSPFRYPGGKTWLIPLIRKWLRSLSKRPAVLIEPFAGGAIVGLTAAFENLANKVILVELDPDVASVWHTILSRDATRLAKKIKEFQFSKKAVASALTNAPRTKLDRAFQTILRNRVQHGGIIAPGASLMKMGENGKGLKSRWYPETLCRRILAVAELRDRIDFSYGDGLWFITKNGKRKNCALFIDPPYTVTGRRLYRHCDIDHARLFKMVANSQCEFMMTYDNSQEIQELAKTNGFDYEEVLMQGRLNSRKSELIIGRDLAWARVEKTTLLPFL